MFVRYTTGCLPNLLIVPYQHVTLFRVASLFSNKTTNHGIRDVGVADELTNHEKNDCVISAKVKGEGNSPKYIPKQLVTYVIYSLGRCPGAVQDIRIFWVAVTVCYA